MLKFMSQWPKILKFLDFRQRMDQVDSRRAAALQGEGAPDQQTAVGRRLGHRRLRERSVLIEGDQRRLRHRRRVLDGEQHQGHPGDGQRRGQEAEGGQ